MSKRKDSKRPITFDGKIKEFLDSKNVVIGEREVLKEKLMEAIQQDKNSVELYNEYCTKDTEINWYDEKIKSLESRRSKIRNLPIYSKTLEWQEEILGWDEVYELLKKENNEELLKALMERKMTVNQYMTLLYSWLAEDGEAKDNRISKVMEKFKSWESSIDVKVWKKRSRKWIKTLNDKWTFETTIGEEYILNRLSHYFSRTWITADDLKAAINFPEWVNISKPEDTEVKFKCNNIEWVIKIKFVILDSNGSHKKDEKDENKSNDAESREKQKKRELSPKELFDSLETFIKNYLESKNLAEVEHEDIKLLLERLENEKQYKEFCKICKKDILNDERVKFPDSFKDLVDKISPIKLNEEMLIAILQSNYKKIDDSWKVSWEVLIFRPFCFEKKDYEWYEDLKNLYGKRLDYSHNGITGEDVTNVINKIHELESKIINTYYPHLKNAYFKHEIKFQSDYKIHI